MPTTTTLYELKSAIKHIKEHNKPLSNVEITLTALAHLLAELELVEDCQNNIIDHLEFAIERQTLIENRYKG